MATNQYNKFVQDHDPDDQLDYTWRFRINLDELMSSAVIEVVDPETGAVDTASDLTVVNTSFGLMPDDLTWGVTTWITGGVPGKTYYLACKINTNSSPLPRIFTRTMALYCRQL